MMVDSQIFGELFLDTTPKNVNEHCRATRSVKMNSFRAVLLAAAVLTCGIVTSKAISPLPVGASPPRLLVVRSWCAETYRPSAALIAADYREDALRKAGITLCSGNVEAARKQYEGLATYWRRHPTDGRQWADVARAYFVTLLASKADSEAAKFAHSLGSFSDLPAGNQIFLREGFGQAALSYARSAAQFDHITHNQDLAILSAVDAAKNHNFDRVLSLLSQTSDAYGYFGQASLHQLLLGEYFVSRQQWHEACEHFARSLASSDPEPGWVSLSRYNLSAMMFLMRYRDHC